MQKHSPRTLKIQSGRCEFCLTLDAIGRLHSHLDADSAPDSRALADDIVSRWNACLDINPEAVPMLYQACIRAEKHIARGEGAPKVVICELIEALAAATRTD